MLAHPFPLLIELLVSAVGFPEGLKVMPAFIPKYQL